MSAKRGQLQFLFSTNGAQFGHPDREAVQRVIARSTRTEPTLYFNYVTERNREWKSCDLQRQLKFGVVYGKSETEPLVVDL